MQGFNNLYVSHWLHNIFFFHNIHHSKRLCSGSVESVFKTKKSIICLLIQKKPGSGLYCKANVLVIFFQTPPKTTLFVTQNEMTISLHILLCNCINLFADSPNQRLSLVRILRKKNYSFFFLLFQTAD